MTLSQKRFGVSSLVAAIFLTGGVTAAFFVFSAQHSSDFKGVECSARHGSTDRRETFQVVLVPPQNSVEYLFQVDGLAKAQGKLRVNSDGLVSYELSYSDGVQYAMAGLGPFPHNSLSMMWKNPVPAGAPAKLTYGLICWTIGSREPLR
ncbi:MAG: hypothetical protein EOP09_05750 [Proteobacteria bacterium]|nr:MAG: hypothetical protein EOP09_05750 [Pseudomonadota bacterium]